MRDLWLPIDPGQDIFFLAPALLRAQKRDLRRMHADVSPVHWECVLRAGQGPQVSAAHFMLDVRSFLQLARECFPEEGDDVVAEVTLGAAPDFLVALSCGVPAIVRNMPVRAWLTMYEEMEIKPERITVMVYRSLADFEAEFEYADLERVLCPPASRKAVLELGPTQSVREQLNELLELWTALMHDAASVGLRFPVLEIAYSRR